MIFPWVRIMNTPSFAWFIAFSPSTLAVAPLTGV
jgi:hypothetical protein